MNLEQARQALCGDAHLIDRALTLQLGECALRLSSNSAALIDRLARYFAHVTGTPGENDIEVVAIEREAPTLDVEFVDWKREPGKTGRKDSYCDLPGARLVRKVRTGMLFLQSESERIAAGPCLRHDNQVINFVNAQYMNWLQQRGWLICHAAGLVHQGQALGIAGFSGGGKSTLMLNMLENPAVNYLTNDRLFVRRAPDRVEAVGIPKLPRINPGTIVHSRRLQPLIPAGERETLLAMPGEALWQLEEKYDVMIDELYGRDRITPHATLGAFLVLNWRRDSAQPLQLQRVDLAARTDLLGAIMKSPGPFYQHADGRFHLDSAPFDEQAYLDVLTGTAVFEAAGRIDFDRLAERCLAEVF